jgi:hypothetical protein
MDSEASEPTSEAPEAPELDEQILRDLESKYAGVLCPVHGVPPSFDVDAKGSMIERFCCESLMQIFRELQAGEPAEEAPDAAV